MNIPYYNFELHVMQNNEADLVHHEIARNVESADTFTSQSKGHVPSPPLRMSIGILCLFMHYM